MSLADAEKATPNFSWTKFMEAEGVTGVEGFSLSQPKFFAEFGKMLGDEKMKTEGKMDKVEGKARNAIGSAKDAVRDAGKPKHH